MRGSVKQEVVAGNREAELAVDGSAHQIRVAVVLPVVLPPANGAQAKRIRNVESFETAAETTHTRK